MGRVVGVACWFANTCTQSSVFDRATVGRLLDYPVILKRIGVEGNGSLVLDC